VTVNKRGLLTGFKWFSLWLIASVALTALVIEVVDPRYLFNDDMVIAAVASGDYTGTPDPHTLNGGALLSVVVATLYGLFPGVAWWLWVLEFLLLAPLCATIIATGRALRSRRFSISSPAGLLLAFVLANYAFFVAAWGLAPTWTVVAFSPGLAALILATLTITGDLVERNSAPLWLAIGLLVSTMGLVRTGGFSLVAFAAVTLAAWAVVLLNTSWRSRLTLLLGIALPVFAEAMFSIRLYADEAWRTARSVFASLHLLVDTYVIGSIFPIASAQNWPSYQVGLISARYFLPSEALTENSLAAFIEAANPYRIGLWAIAPPTWDNLASSLSSVRAGASLVVVGFIISSLFLAAVGRLDKSTFLVLSGSALTSTCVIGLLGYIRISPGHVAISLGFASLLALCCVAILRSGGAILVGYSGTLLPLKLPRWSLFVVVAVGVIMPLVLTIPYTPLNLSRELNRKVEAWPVYEETYSSLEAGCPILGVNLGFELAPANAPTPAREFPVIQLSWNSLTPLTDERLKLLGFEKWDDLFAEGACTYFMGGGDYANAMTEYARDRGGVGEFVKVEVPVEGAPEIYQWQNP
jgi:hypothetical protein